MPGPSSSQVWQLRVGSEGSSSDGNLAKVEGHLGQSWHRVEAGHKKGNHQLQELETELETRLISESDADHLAFVLLFGGIAGLAKHEGLAGLWSQVPCGGEYFHECNSPSRTALVGLGPIHCVIMVERGRWLIWAEKIRFF